MRATLSFDRGSERQSLANAIPISLCLCVTLILISGCARTDIKKEDAESNRNSRVWARLAAIGVRESRPEGPLHWPFRDVTVSGGMPQALRSRAEEVLGEPRPLGLHFDQARRAEMPNGAVLWLVVGRGVACLFREVTATVACRTILQTYRQGIVLQVFKMSRSRGKARPSRFMVFGIAPDWVKRVTLKIGRRRHSVRVRNNAYTATSKRPIAVLPAKAP